MSLTKNQQFIVNVAMKLMGVIADMVPKKTGLKNEAEAQNRRVLDLTEDLCRVGANTLIDLNRIANALEISAGYAAPADILGVAFPSKQTSPEVAHLAGEILGTPFERLLEMVKKNPDLAAGHLRTLAGSALSQDEPVREETANLGLATNAEIEAEIKARTAMGHTAPSYKTVG